MDQKLLDEIEGAEALIEYFGRWPSFHDAEVVHLHLNRQGESVLRIHAFSMTNRIDERGYYVNEKHTLIDFFLLDVEDCTLDAFNHQNVIGNIDIQKTDKIELSFDGIYGLTGSIRCKALRISFNPGIPPASVYS